MTNITTHIADMLTEHMSISGLIKQDEKKIYRYYIQILIEKIIGFSAIFSLSIIWGILLETVLFLLCFSSLRKHTGGFHAKSFGGCFIGTIGIYSAYVKLFSPIIHKNMNINMIMFIIAGIVIFIIGAVNHPNMGWSKEEYNDNKMLARIIVVVESCIVIALSYVGMEENYILFMSFGMILCASLLALGKIIRQEVKG